MEPNLPTPIMQEMNNTQGGEATANQYRRPVITGESTSALEKVGNVARPVVPAQPPQQQMQAFQQSVQIPGGHSDNAVAASGVAIADDVDVIEKEWVDKAKLIVNQTKGDPYHQEKQVSQLQADYLKKRYNKTVKLAD
jgi:hypothetical protein